MRLRICHLSDIHFCIENNSIENKRELLCKAVLEDSYRYENILFLISGDIAQSGLEKEYEVARYFFGYIQERLYSQKYINSYFVFAPGNHDCFFKKDDFDEEMRRKEVLSKKGELENDKLLFLEKKLCEKQVEYIKFVDKFTKNNMTLKSYRIKEFETPLLIQHDLELGEQKININILNSSWISQRKENPGELYIPKTDYINMKRKEGLNITIYHHPSNWMHPDDKLEFDSYVFGQSDIVFVGHEHIGRNQYIQTRDAEYEVQYGEVLQNLYDENDSGFIINNIDGQMFSTTVYKWNVEQDFYKKTVLPDKKLGNNINKSIVFIPQFRESLNSFDMQVSHPKKRKVLLSDLFIYPDVEEYNENEDIEEITKDKTTIKGSCLEEYILKNKLVEFSGVSKTGKTALAKMLALSFEKRDIHAVIIDCNKNPNVLLKKIDSIYNTSIEEAYGKEKLEIYKQLPLCNKILFLDNIDKISYQKGRNGIIEYFSNYFDYIIMLSGMAYELSIFGERMRHTELKIKHCDIKELGHKQRNSLLNKWYSLNEGDDVLVDDEIRKNVKEATSTINTLKGNGYMPCIAPTLIIILQQLEYQSERKQDRSNYGYMYEFLITKAILDMKKNNGKIHEDIASGILINVAKYMLQKKQRIILKHEFLDIIEQYNKDYITDVSKEAYLSGYVKGDLLECENEEIKFKFPYIHYYFTAKYLSNNIEDESIKKAIDYMSSNLQDEECGDIMIFLCHLSKNNYIINSVLKSSACILKTTEKFDFDKYKSLSFNFDEYVEKELTPEEGIEERQDDILQRQDEYEEAKKGEHKTEVKEKEDSQEMIEKMRILDSAYKSIEVMGQILKNYPGTIGGITKKNLLCGIHDLGMRTLTYTNEILYGELEKAFSEVQNIVYAKIVEENQKQDTAIDDKMIWKIVKESFLQIKLQMDNLFGLMSYTMLRRLSNSVGNEILKTLIVGMNEIEELSFELMKCSVFLNEFGIIQSEYIISLYEKLLKDNVFAAKLLKLFVYEHYYVFGSHDVRARQKIWSKFGFDEKKSKTMMLNGSIK